MSALDPFAALRLQRGAEHLHRLGRHPIGPRELGVPLQ
jgi:hypothetical protein